MAGSRGLVRAHFLKRFADEPKPAVPVLSIEAKQALMAYDYPGNMRELKSILERAFIESAGKTIQEHPLHLLKEKALIQSGSPSSPVGRPADDLPRNLEQAQIEWAEGALAKADGDLWEAAQLLGINRTQGYRILSSSDEEECPA